MSATKNLHNSFDINQRAESLNDELVATKCNIVAQSRSWAQQRALKGLPIPTLADVIRKIASIPSPRDKSLHTLCYLTAGRITEVLDVRKENITFITKNNRPIMLIDIPNRKNPTRKRKHIPIMLDGSDNDLAEIIKQYINPLEPGAFLFPSSFHGGQKPISAARAWQILTNASTWPPHWWRHLRLSHLASTYGLPDHHLILYAGWSDSRPAKNYIEMRWTDLLDKL